ncbi:MAG: hypothetical protein D6679_07935 [Candidatus Hydrogenedentota bacterium]|nr:MAG: hypothetical protein D6679_07935 [Candidatus Hydrogenedentota bacterium]
MFSENIRASVLRTPKKFFILNPSSISFRMIPFFAFCFSSIFVKTRHLKHRSDPPFTPISRPLLFPLKTPPTSFLSSSLGRAKGLTMERVPVFFMVSFSID